MRSACTRHLIGSPRRLSIGSPTIHLFIYCRIGRQSGNFIILHIDNETKAQLPSLWNRKRRTTNLERTWSFLKNGFIRRRALPKKFLSALGGHLISANNPHKQEEDRKYNPYSFKMGSDHITRDSLRHTRDPTLKDFLKVWMWFPSLA